MSPMFRTSVEYTSVSPILGPLSSTQSYHICSGPLGSTLPYLLCSGPLWSGANMFRWPTPRTDFWSAYEEILGHFGIKLGVRRHITLSSEGGAYDIDGIGIQNTIGTEASGSLDSIRLMSRNGSRDHQIFSEKLFETENAKPLAKRQDKFSHSEKHVSATSLRQKNSDDLSTDASNDIFPQFPKRTAEQTKDGSYTLVT